MTTAREAIAHVLREADLHFVDDPTVPDLILAALDVGGFAIVPKSARVRVTVEGQTAIDVPLGDIAAVISPSPDRAIEADWVARGMTGDKWTARHPVEPGTGTQDEASEMTPAKFDYALARVSAGRAPSPQGQTNTPTPERDSVHTAVSATGHSSEQPAASREASPSRSGTHSDDARARLVADLHIAAIFMRAMSRGDDDDAVAREMGDAADTIAKDGERIERADDRRKRAEAMNDALASQVAELRKALREADRLIPELLRHASGYDYSTVGKAELMVLKQNAEQWVPRARSALANSEGGQS